MSIEPGNFAGATAIGAPSHNFSDQAPLPLQIDPALRYWLAGSPSDEIAINETRRATSEYLHAAFPEQDSDWLVTASTAVLNSIPISEVIDLAVHKWVIQHSDELGDAVRCSLLWLAALEGDAVALGILARQLGQSNKFSAGDRMAAIRAIANVASTYAAHVSLEFRAADDNPYLIEIYDADAEANPIASNFDLPALLAGDEPNTVVCATREALEAAEDMIRRQSIRNCVRLPT